MFHSQLDHLVITAPSLAAGVDYVREMLGVAPQPGGRHPRMGTHNALLKLGKAAYLEVIAVDPGAPAPPWPAGSGSTGPRPRRRRSRPGSPGPMPSKPRRRYSRSSAGLNP